MAVYSISRFLSSSSSYLFKNPRFLLTLRRPITTASAAENYWNLLQKYGSESNLERTLGKIRAKLDSSCVEQVLRRCSVNRTLLGLRFFIWAGQQSDYRHSTLIYSKACKLVEIDRRPQYLYDILRTYRIEGCLVSVKTFKVILNLCREAKLAEEALGVLRKMAEFDCRPDTTSYNVVIRLFSEKGDMDLAMGLMKEMALIDLYPDMITYVLMIKGFCNVGRLDDACGLFKVMTGHGCFPNVVAYSALLDGVCKSGSLERALELLGEMEKEGDNPTPNVVTYTSVIQSFCGNGRSMEALSILDRMGAHGCPPNRVTISTLIKGLCVEGSILEAYKLIDKVIVDGSVLNSGFYYSSFVVCLLRIKNMEEAEKLFRRMLASGVKPNGLACNSLIKEICSEGRALDGFGLYRELEKMEFLASVDTDIYSVLLVGLFQQGHLSEASKFASVMVERGVPLKTPYVDSIVDHLKKSGQKDLVSRLTNIGG
ncbi:hypothetical protein HHK36_010351 [Tetracentron sinense]|uniref:Pentatricopeptide repeat-containing protein n=1 Tax=Tetracentron sinense TaxID=13715 RepID=A0A834ZHD2_TETSI|nr:hypothetical protein HHK36_010351 [Tetracentron sinense]